MKKTFTLFCFLTVLITLPVYSKTEIKEANPTPGAIIVSSPNGGEFFNNGDLVNITYTTSGSVSSTLNVELYKGSTLISGPFTFTKNTNPTPLSTVGLLSGNDYRIHIYDVATPSIQDWTDGYFIIGGNSTVKQGILTSGVLQESDIQSLSSNQLVQQTVYADDLGRARQIVNLQASPSMSDQVTDIWYDSRGLRSYSFPPITSNLNTGNYKPGVLTAAVDFSDITYVNSLHYKFYNNSSADPTYKIADDLQPYAYTLFEASPMGRVLRTEGVGQAWTGRGISYAYTTNSDLNVRNWTVGDDGLLASSGAYAAGTLKFITTTNEEGISNTVIYNMEGIKIAEKVHTSSSSGYAETYYVYDIYNNLRFILSPEFIKLYPTGTTTLTINPTDVNTWCYQYIYDNLNRPIQTKSPGIEWVYTIYDSRDRVTLTQNGNQRAINTWSYVKYDELDRPVILGIYSPGSVVSQTSMQSTIDALAGNLGYQNVAPDIVTTSATGMKTGVDITVSAYESINDYQASHSITFGSGFSFHSGVTGPALHVSVFNAADKGGTDVFPTTNEERLVKNYFDNYQNCEICLETNYQFVAESWGTTPSGPITSNEPYAVISRVKGNLVASMTKVMGNNMWLNTVSYYNRHHEPIQTIFSNHLGGRDRASALTDFGGKLLATLNTSLEYNSGGISSRRERYTYDPGGRLINTFHQINSQPEIILTSLDYNELGQVIKKKIHGTGSTPAFLQAEDFRYNIHGWLTSLNNTIPDAGDPTPDYFSMGLTYEGTLSGNKPRKDGAITSLQWKHDLSSKQRLYNFTYTDRGFLQDSQYKMTPDNGVSWNGETDFYSEDVIKYDLNGNISQLNRRKESFDGTANTSDYIDLLKYTYSGNQLMKVDDQATSVNKQLGFNDGNTGIDYAYDANGNLILDKNKNILSITYYYNNLPCRITLGTSTYPYLQYTYSATGEKLCETYAFVNPQTNLPEKVVTDYVGGFVYVNGQVLFINNREGRIVAPTYSNLIVNREANSLDGFATSPNTSNPNDPFVSLSETYANGQTYIKAVYNHGTTTTPGIFPLTTTKGVSYPVASGESYVFKVLGYQAAGTSATIYIKTNLGNLTIPAVTLPIGTSNENWSTVAFTIPANVTSIQLGIQWTAPANNNAFYINRVALYKTDFEYQYFLKDQIGSPRVVLQTNPNVITYTATMEIENQVTEDNQQKDAQGNSGQFQNMNYANVHASPGNTTPGGSKAITMSTTFTVGPAKSLKVYPGDVVNASVNAYYPAGVTYSSGLASMVTNVVSSFGGGTSGSLGDPGSIFNGVNNSYSPTGVLAASRQSQGTSSPSAFLNYILFDKDYNPIGGRCVPVPTGSPNIIQPMSLPQINVQEPGYIFVYLSYDNVTGGEVYFDDLKITQAESNVIQVNSYYPYGQLAYSWTREGETNNAYLFQEKELSVRTGWHDFHARQYDAALGRWFVADPAKQFDNPYSAMGNNPVMYSDPDGKFINLIIGALIGGVSSYIGGRDAGLRGWDLVGFTALGAGLGAVTSGIGSEVGSSVAMSSGSVIAGAAAGGAAAGAVSGFYSSESNPLDGTWKGALTGMVGGVTGSVFTGGLGAFVGGAAAGATNAALNHGDILQGAMLGGTISFGAYHVMALVTFSRESDNEAFNKLSLGDKYRYSKAIQKTLLKNKEYASEIYGDGSRSKLLKSEGEERDAPKTLKGFNIRHPVTGEIKHTLRVDVCQIFYNMIDPSEIWNESVIADLHTHLGYGTTSFSTSADGDIPFFEQKNVPHGFMMNGTEIHYWSSTTGDQYIGQTNRYLMRSVFGF